MTANVDLPGRLVVVTGASSGLGEAAAGVLARAGARVVLAVRDEARGEAAALRIRGTCPRASLEVARLELSELESVREFARRYAGETIDLLINNAGLVPGPERVFTVDGAELAMGVNHLGHFALTGLLLPALLRSDHARVVHLGSMAIRAAGRLDRRFGESGRWDPARAYAQSKLACALFGVELDRRMAGCHLTSVIADPGWSGTRLFRNSGPVDSWSLRLGSTPEQGAMSLVRAGCDLSVLGGDYVAPRWGSHGRPRVRSAGAGALGWALSDAAGAAALWEFSEQRTGVRFAG